LSATTTSQRESAGRTAASRSSVSPSKSARLKVGMMTEAKGARADGLVSTPVEMQRLCRMDQVQITAQCARECPATWHDPSKCPPSSQLRKKISRQLSRSLRWQDNGYGLNLPGPVLYLEAGTQTMRIQQTGRDLDRSDRVIADLLSVGVARGGPQRRQDSAADP